MTLTLVEELLHVVFIRFSFQYFVVINVLGHRNVVDEAEGLFVVEAFHSDAPRHWLWLLLPFKFATSWFETHVGLGEVLNELVGGLA